MVFAKVPLLLCNKNLKLWNSKFDIKNNILETFIDGTDKDFEIVDTFSNHYALVLGQEKKR